MMSSNVKELKGEGEKKEEEDPRKGMAECAMTRLLAAKIPAEVAEEAVEILKEHTVWEMSRLLEDETRWKKEAQKALRGVHPPSRQKEKAQPTPHEQKKKGRGEVVVVATCNVQHLGGEGRKEEVAEALRVQGVDLAVLQETRCRKMQNEEGGEYTFYTTVPEPQRRGRNGCGMAIRTKELKKWMDGGQIDLVSDRVMVARMPGLGMNVVVVYAPTNEYPREEKDQFELELRTTLEKYRTKRMLVMGDFNATMTQEDGTVRGVNDNGERLEAYWTDYDLRPQNWRWGTEESQWTWGGSPLAPQRTLDWILASEDIDKEVEKCETVEFLAETDHRMVRIEVRAKGREVMEKPRKKRRRTREHPPENAVQVERVWAQWRGKATVKKIKEERKPRKDFITEETWRMLKKKYVTLAAWRTEKDPQKKDMAKEELGEIQRQTKEALRRDRLSWWEKRAAETQKAAMECNVAAVYRALRPFYRRRAKRMGFRRSEMELKRGLEHFKKILTEPPKPPVEAIELATTTKFEARPAPPLPMKKTVVYTDGSMMKISEDVKKAGYGVHFPEYPERDVAGRCAEGDEESSLRAELWAMWKALEECKKRGETTVEIVTDSRVMVEGFPKARTVWRAANFDHIPQGEVWREVVRMAKGMEVSLRWMKSHQTGTGRDIEGNATADALAAIGREMMMRPATFDKKPLGHWAVEDEVPKEEEVLKALKQLNKNGAPGVDGVTAGEIRESEEMQKILVETIQVAWQTGKVPREWTEAKLVAIPKKSGAVEWNEHRGITLLVVASKVLTRLMLTRLATVPLADWQFGFRRGRDATMAVAVVRHVLDETKRTNKRCTVAFLDLQKAYDSVNRQKMWESMRLVGMGCKMEALLREMYEDEVIVQVDGEEVGSFASTSGVRQGCILSPLAFNVVLDRAVEAVWTQMTGVKLRGPNGEVEEVKIVAYADDMAVMANNKKELRHNLQKLERALATVGLTISVEKTKVMTIVPKVIKQEMTAESYARGCERRRLGRSEGKGTATVAAMTKEEKRWVIRWGGGVQRCPKCEFSTPVIGALRDHLRRKHPELQVAVLATMNPYVHEKFAGKLEEKRCLGCGEEFSSRSNARRHVERGACGGQGDAGSPRTRSSPPRSGGKEVAEGDQRRLCRCRCKNKERCLHGCCKEWGKLEKKGEEKAGMEESEEEPEEQEEDEETEVGEDGEVTIYGKKVEEVGKFKYLGRMLTANGNEEEEVKGKVAAARGTMAALMLPLNKRDAVSGKTKLEVFRTVAVGQMLYAAETWTLREAEWRRVKSFEMQYLRRVVGWGGRMTEEGIRYPKSEDVVAEVERMQGKKYDTLRMLVEWKQVKWWGMVQRMEETSMVRRVLMARMEGVARRGWKMSMGLVPVLRGRVQEAGLSSKDLWVRSRWGKPKTLGEKEDGGDAEGVPRPPSRWRTRGRADAAASSGISAPPPAAL